jgi:hypothetical protein
VKVINPKVVPSADFELSMVDSLGGTNILNGSSTSWTLKNLTTGEIVNSDFTIDIESEQVIPDWGLSVYTQQVRNPGGTEDIQFVTNNGFIEATIQFADPQNTWLSGLADQEGESPFNWIRAGTFNPDGTQFPDYVGVDNFQVYEHMLSGTWAPYRLAAAIGVVSPAWTPFLSSIVLDSLVNVDIVFTADSSKWSQCVVVEEEEEEALSEGNAAKLDLRDTYSRNKDGSQNLSEKGRSWFPGYAINTVTGERLNIFFGEDSWLVGQNGGDMLWNPTSQVVSPTFDIWLGGKHYIYVSTTKYDGCENFRNLLESGGTTDKKIVYTSLAWTGIPLLNVNSDFLPLEQGLIPTETKLRFRVTKPYARYATDVSQNGNQPRYTFNTASLAAVQNDLPTAVNALDTINIVPNPYYAYSAYEVSQVDHRVKIVNLPQKCTVRIYALDGTLIRKINRDDSSVTSLDWDLNNDAGIPIASGLYIIHIDAPGIGEKTLKWFGVLRPADLDAY